MQHKKEIFQNTLATIIKLNRKQARLSISRAANEIELSKSVWAAIEKGDRDPQLSTLWKISEALNISLTDIISEMQTKLGHDFFLE